MSVEFSNAYQEILLDNLMSIIKQNFVFQTQLKMSEDIGKQKSEIQAKYNELLATVNTLQSQAKEAESLKSIAHMNDSAHQEKSRIQLALNNEMKKSSEFKKQLEETGKIKLFEGSKEFYRDFVSVEEVIEKKFYCLENKPSGVYDIGTAKPKSFYDVAIEICGSDDYIEWVPMPDNLKEHYQKYTCANMDWYYSNL